MSAFHRCLVLAAEVAAKTEAAAAAGPTSSAKRRGKNFFEVAALLPNWGVGAKLRRKSWSESEYYEVTKIKVKSEDGRYGAAWGIRYSSPYHPGPAEEKIRGLAKHDWKYVEEKNERVIWKEVYREKKGGSK